MRYSGSFATDEIFASFTCKMEKDDYGVPGSPVWLNPVGVELTSVEILKVKIADPSKLPAELYGAIHDLHEHVDNWEID